jgi:hypothetical protein
VLGAAWRNEAVAPGPLSAHHARLLHGEASSERCAACHPGGNASLAAWIAGSSEPSDGPSTQTGLCLVCHAATIDRQFATAAHASPPERWAVEATDATDAARRRDPHEPLACAACHREHQGVEHDLTRIDDRACQACHRQQIRSFASDHPEFHGWPEPRQKTVRFSHATHELQHFPRTKRDYQCALCHEPGPDGVQQTLGYRAACAACHDAALQQSLAGGLPLFALPELDLAALREAGRAPDAWPPEAEGDFDGQLPAAARVLLAADPRGAAAFARLGPRFDAFDVAADDAAELAALADVVQAQRDLIDLVADRGPNGLADRCADVLGRPLAPEAVADLTRGLSSDLGRAYRDRWFGDATRRDALAEAPRQSAALRASLPAGGGWLRDERARSLVYVPAGHADPVVRAWIDLAVAAAQGPAAAWAAELRQEWIGPQAPGGCGTCHATRRDASGATSVAWEARRSQTSLGALTRFSHAPHVVQPVLGDCRACHRLPDVSAGSGVALASTTADSAAESESIVEPAASGETGAACGGDFAPLQRDLCAQCHRPHAAGDRCTQCHVYHPLRIFDAVPPASR